MKSTLLYSLLLTATLISCQKENDLNGPGTLESGTSGQMTGLGQGCLEKITAPVSAHKIAPTLLPLVNSLFEKNGIDKSQFRFDRYIRDTALTLSPPFARLDNHHVVVNQYTNGLRIFTGQVGYHFNKDKLYFQSGKLSKGTSLDTRPQLTLDQLRKLFLRDIEIYDHSGKQYQDSCLTAEFGYYNINAGISNSQEILVKAWRVSPKDREYFYAYYRDTGTLIYFDNGIRTTR